jgi:hypothetical protein
MPITSLSTAGVSGPRSDEVADEHSGAPVRVRRPVGADRIPEPGEQLDQLGVAAVHVADDVERAGEVAAVVVQPVVADLELGEVGLGQDVGRRR